MEEIKNIVPRKVVQDFAIEMEKRLKDNDYKGHWKDCSTFYLVNRLNQKVKEVEKALSLYCIHCERSYNENKGNIKEKCVDVANFAMMIADNEG